MRTISTFALWLATGVLVGCGGGGGGGGFVAEPTAVIDGGSAQAIAGAAVAGNLALVSDVASTGAGVSSQTGGSAVRGALLRILGGDGSRIAIRSLTAEAVRVEPQLAVGPVTEDCLASGTTRISGSVADPNTLSPGDSLSVTFIACDDGDGSLLNGTMRLRVASFSGDVLNGFFRLVADTTFSSLAVTTGTETGTLNGVASITFDTTDVSREMLRLVADSLRFTSNGDVFQLNDYDVTGATLLDTSEYTLDVTGYLQNSSAFTGIVRLDTVTLFTGDADAYPSAGHLIITGANSSTVDVESLDAVHARLHIDADGDGVAEDIQDVDWSELTGGP